MSSTRPETQGDPRAERSAADDSSRKTKAKRPAPTPRWFVFGDWRTDASSQEFVLC